LDLEFEGREVDAFERGGSKTGGSRIVHEYHDGGPGEGMMIKTPMGA
jgi:hypothetical protein